MNERDKRKLATIEAGFCTMLEEKDAQLTLLRSLVFGDELVDAEAGHSKITRGILVHFQQAIKERMGEI